MIYFLGGASSHVMHDFVYTAFIPYWILMSCVVFYFPRFIAVGQVLRATPAKQFFVKNKKTFKSLQEVSGIMFIDLLVHSAVGSCFVFGHLLCTLFLHPNFIRYSPQLPFSHYLSVYPYWTRMERIL